MNKNPSTISKLKTIVEAPEYIILSKYEAIENKNQGYQSEKDLEEYLISSLLSQGYERLFINSTEELYSNLRLKLEALNDYKFTDNEWQRFLDEYLDSANDTIVEKTRKVQEQHIYDLKLDDGSLRNIKIIDKQRIFRNSLQVINQVKQEGKFVNIYDVTILVNGLPLVHIELKRRGVNIVEAFNQIDRYSRETFNYENSLYKFVQIFIISNGTYTRYFANTISRDRSSYEFTSEWADARNNVISDLEDFTRTFLAKNTILQILTKYCVFDVNNNLLIMRPYQIAAAERILWKIQSSYENDKYGRIEGGGYIWHTTGSGKTLTSYKAARLASELPYIDKVLFVVDRRDLDFQTVREFERFEPGCVSSSQNSFALTQNLESNREKRIVVTTIQKLNEFLKKNPRHEIYNKHCVLIFDECHRSQFGEVQKLIRQKFNKHYQFGFTGTPIFVDNALNPYITTETIFGAQLHAYVITDAIRDNKVLKFKVDYNNVAPKYKDAEIKSDETEEETKNKTQNTLSNSKLLLLDERISEVTKYVLKQFNRKTHRNELSTFAEKRRQGFNAMFCVESVEALKKYYLEFQKQQESLPEDKRLIIGTIFSVMPNEQASYIGELPDEELNINEKTNLTQKEFLVKVMEDYNKTFKTNFALQHQNGFENYYRDLQRRIKNKEVDLVIVVNMLLTGFDAPWLNTLFVDKNLRYHGLIQAFSRTNRILNINKPFGNIVCFRNLQKATEKAISLFGDENNIRIILERGFKDYIDGYIDPENPKKNIIGYKNICHKLQSKFPYPDQIKSEAAQKEFVETFGQYLKTVNVLRNFDEFNDYPDVFTPRQVQDMTSVYIDIREEIQNKNRIRIKEESTVNFDDIEFYIELLKTDEVNLDYILELIFKNAKEEGDLDKFKVEVKSIIQSTLGIRSKEDLIMEFVDTLDIDKLESVSDIISSFHQYAQEKKDKSIQQVIQEENLNENAQNYIKKVISDGEANVAGGDLDSILPPTSRMNNQRAKKRNKVLSKIRKIIEVFFGI